MPSPSPSPWAVDAADYPRHGSREEQLRFLLGYAVLAPSGHNTQPWRFRIADGTVRLYADRDRRLPVVDPDDRELIISCGAALFHLRLALRYFGHRDTVRPFPDPADPDLLAEVVPADAAAPDATDRALFAAIPRRFTHRGAVRDTPVPPELRHLLDWLVEHEGAHLTCLAEPAAKDAVAELVAEGDRTQAADPAFRRELAAWVRPNPTRRGDGIPGYAFGVGTPASLVGPWFLRWTNWGAGQAARDRRLAAEAPALGLLSTVRDGRDCWLAAGQALAALLLRAAEDGVQAAYLNQPIELAALRPRLAEAAGVGGHPQILLRLGYPRAGRRPTPRRPVAEVTDERSARS